MFSWIHPHLEIRPSKKIDGAGVFTHDSLLKNEKLIVFGGYVMTLNQEENLPRDIVDCAHQIDDDMVIGINTPDQLGLSDKLNHSCEPNAGFKGQVFLVAMRDIAAGEEITFDYAMTLGGEVAYQLKCQCMAQNCRKIVTNQDWKDPVLQEKYAGFFQYYLEQKIANKNTNV